MGLIQSIENRLIEINETVFQELCDSFLILMNENYAAFSRTGSQAGKQKTRKGTPDSFLLLPNGKYVFIEFSTNVTQKIKKLKEDILKCLDVEKTGVSHSQIAEIILCVNFKLDTSEIEDLLSEVRGTNIKLTIFTLDRLALEIALKYKSLAREHLGLNIDSGQIVSIETFIKEYTKAFNRIATPLDNEFLFREKEKEEIFNSLHQSDLILVSGAPGVGKTRLVLETITSYINENPSYQAYCISNKQYPILEDLNNYFNQESDYILFIDDANRIETLSQILAFHNKFSDGNFKIVLTVRDYAIKEIQKFISSKKKAMISIEKLSDEELTKIIEASPFQILNSKYQREILNIADGNPRIAIMVALLAIEKQNISVFQDLGEVFETYFSVFATDYLDMTKETTVKCLGLIAAFHILPYKEKVILQSILEKFDIDYDDFINEIDWLESIELVEIQYDHVKITEQNISNYFFYLAFIKNEFLSFKILLTYFYSNKTERIKDSILAANNSFGYEKVIKKVKNILVSYFESLDEDEQKLAFLQTFWFYLQEEFMGYIFTYLNETLGEVINEDETLYKTEYTKNQFSYNRNPIIELFGYYCEFIQNDLKDILLLSLEYVRKLPSELPELLYQFKKSFALNWYDERSGYYRQHVLLDILEEGIKQNNYLYKIIYFKMATFLLKSEFEYIRSERGKIIIERVDVGATPKIIELRKRIMDVLLREAERESVQVVNVLNSYVNTYGLDSNLATIEKANIERIFDVVLVPTNLEHSLLFNRYLEMLDRLNIEKEELVQKFNLYKTDDFNMIQVLDWERLSGKNRSYFEEYDKAKEIEIRNNFNFNQISDSQKFLDDYMRLSKFIENNWNKSKVLNIILDQNLLKDNELNMSLLEAFIQTTELDFIPDLIFDTIVTSKEWREQIYTFILNLDNPKKVYLLLNLLIRLQLENIEEKHIDDFLRLLKECTNKIYIRLDQLKNMLEYKPYFLNELIKITVDSNPNINIVMWRFNDLVKYFDTINDLELYKQLLCNHLDEYINFYRYKEFLFYLFEKDNSLLILYLQLISTKGSYEKVALNVVWELNQPYVLMTEVFDLVLKNGIYISNHFGNMLFKDLKKQHIEVAKGCLLNYVSKNNKDIKKMNLVLDIVHNSQESWLQDVLTHYLTLNKNLKSFRSIHWLKRSRGFSGDVLFSEIEAVDWSHIQSIVKGMNGGIELIPIKKFISDVLSSLTESAEDEKKKKYLSER